MTMQLDRISEGADPAGPIEAFKRGIKGVFDYRGVAPRSEFWTLVAIMYCLLGVCVIMTPAKSNIWEEGNLLANVAYSVSMLVVLASSSRRLRDIGKSGWWLLIGMSGIGLCLLIWWWSLPGIAQEK